MRGEHFCSPPRPPLPTSPVPNRVNDDLEKRESDESDIDNDESNE